MEPDIETTIVNNNNNNNNDDKDSIKIDRAAKVKNQKEVDMQLQRIDDVSLNILGVRLQDKLDRLMTQEDQVANFVCDCGKPLKQNAFFPCAVQAYLSQTMNVEVFKKILTSYIENESKKKNATEEDKLLASYIENESNALEMDVKFGGKDRIDFVNELDTNGCSLEDTDKMLETYIKSEHKTDGSNSMNELIKRFVQYINQMEQPETMVDSDDELNKTDNVIVDFKKKAKKDNSMSDLIRRFVQYVNKMETKDVTEDFENKKVKYMSDSIKHFVQYMNEMQQSDTIVNKSKKLKNNTTNDLLKHYVNETDESERIVNKTKNVFKESKKNKMNDLIKHFINESKTKDVQNSNIRSTNDIIKLHMSEMDQSKARRSKKRRHRAARPSHQSKVAQVKLGGKRRRGGGRRRRGASIATRGRRRGAQPRGRSRRPEAPAARRHCRCALALCDRIHTLLLSIAADKSAKSAEGGTAPIDAAKPSDNTTEAIRKSSSVTAGTVDKTESLKSVERGTVPKSIDATSVPIFIHESIDLSIEKSESDFRDLDSDEARELEEFEQQERWASGEDCSYDIESSCTFDVNNFDAYERSSAISLCYDELLDPSDEEVNFDSIEMRGDQRGAANAAAEDKRHNKDVTKLKSSIKKTPRKSKKNRVTFNENKNEFFEADYIILIREECQYDEESDEGICTCSQHEMVRLTCCDNECNGYERETGGCGPPGEFVDQVTLSPPEGYKDSGLFNQDGTFKDQSFFSREGPGLIVSEGTGAVFTPQHLRQLQVIQRLQREQLRRARASLVADAETNEQHTESVHPDESTTSTLPDHGFSEKDRSKGFYAKEIVAGEERPKVNSGQQTTPTDDEGQLYTGESITTRSVSDTKISKENSSSASEENGSQEQPVDSSPVRLGGILKGGRLWKSMEAGVKPETQQQIDTEESGNYSNSASDEEGRANRAVRFSEPPPRDPNADPQQDSDDAPKSHLALTFRLGNHLLSNNSLRPNSAVRQLFPAGPHLVTPPQRAEDDKRYLVTTESLRAFEEAKRSRLPSTYRDEDSTIRRNIDRNTLRRSLIKVDPRKKTPPKNDTSLTERIKMLTCNIDDEEAEAEPEQEQDRISPSGEEPRQSAAPSIKSFSPSSSSSASSCSSTSSTYKKLTEIFPKRQECISECNEEGSNVVIIPQNSEKVVEAQNVQDRRQYIPKIMQCSGNKSGERLSLSSTGTEFSLTDIEASLDMPAPDVLAGTPGAGDGDELARFVQQDAARTERLRRRYQPSAENSDEDDQDDYGFQRRPSVRGIKPRFGSTNEILQQMQAQLQMGTTTPTTRPGHVSWPYYSESNLTQPAQHEHVVHNPEGMHTRSSTEDFQQNLKMGSTAELANQSARDCYDLRNHNVPEHMQHVEHMQHMQHAQHKRVHDDSIYQNCVTYANIRCSVGERDLYSSQSSLVPIGSMPHMPPGYDSQQRNHRRPESPPPIRSYHQTMVLIPYSNLHQPHYSNTIDRSYTHAHSMTAEQNGSHGYQHQAVNDQQPTLLKLSQAPQQLVGIPFPQSGVPMQITCSAPAAHIRTVPSRPVARHMICYSEKVEAPMYQAAPGSPVAVRGAPEGAPAPAASPTVPHNYPPHNSLYYAMNV